VKTTGILRDRARSFTFGCETAALALLRKTKKIFQKFFRSEDPKTREVTGTGLGLNITRSLVEMQGGKIWFESEYRKGTTFHFTIPVAD
jgi:signal transduction histidine kinase